MSDIRTTVLALLLAGASLGAAAQTAAEHEQHHPGGAAATPAAPPAAQPATPPNALGPSQTSNMARMDEHMKAMRAMHDKMAVASTPEERQALMAEHMKLMQQGKGMPADLAARHQMMEKRMEMMESMMQMMMDRLPPAQ